MLLFRTGFRLFLFEEPSRFLRGLGIKLHISLPLASEDVGDGDFACLRWIGSVRRRKLVVLLGIFILFRLLGSLLGVTSSTILHLRDLGEEGGIGAQLGPHIGALVDEGGELAQHLLVIDGARRSGV